MDSLQRLHKRLYHPLRAEETVHHRENEYNYLIENYELDIPSIAKYLLAIRKTTEERRILIHRLIPDRWEYAEALIHLSDCYEKLENNDNTA